MVAFLAFLRRVISATRSSIEMLLVFSVAKEEPTAPRARALCFHCRRAKAAGHTGFAAFDEPQSSVILTSARPSEYAMSPSLDELKATLSTLSVPDRTELVDFLLSSLEP